jgi:MYXO-CTERM domain-containing protein
MARRISLVIAQGGHHPRTETGPAELAGSCAITTASSPGTLAWVLVLLVVLLACRHRSRGAKGRAV